jgi:AmmeMemoRadiSam system protein B/AmmeMemoRadiSam system protein A
MKALRYLVKSIFILFLVPVSCHARPDTPVQEGTDRMPAVAGAFYPASASELREMLSQFFNSASPMTKSQPLAIIVPHAGYVYSGEVAATGFRQLDRERRIDHVFLIGSSHTMYFNGAAVYAQGNFITPLGKVRIDPLAAELVKNYRIFSDDPAPHAKEHSLEVQLPFLQYWLKNDFTIVPIILGGESTETSRKVAEALAPWFNENNLFVISTDFSHYPEYEQAVKCDDAMAGAVLSNSTEIFMKTKNSLENRGTKNLATAMCGWTSVLALLDITQDRTDLEYKHLLYRNSGDSPYGDHGRVVGYNAICVLKKNNPKPDTTLKLTDEEKKDLLRLARNTIKDHLEGKPLSEIDERTLTTTLKTRAGAFVTLTREGQLRGCIGRFEPNDPLYRTVQNMAIAAATRDPRFRPVTMEEFPDLEIEISVLTPMKRIENINEIELGKDGIYIKKGGQSGTFLPQVATGTGWSLEEFLGHCARDKAGIGWEGWKSAEIYTYEALVFSEHDFKN